MGTFTTTAQNPQKGLGTFQDSGSIGGKTVKLDPRVEAIMQQAAAASPYNVVAFSGVQGRAAGTGNHPGGYAVDVYLQDPKTGQLLTNYGGSAFARQGSYQENFPAYEQFAQTARVVQQKTYPELNNTFRWGGYFNAGPGNSSPDLMHFDITPKMGGVMGGGTWADGASKQFQSTYKIASNGGLKANPRLANQVETQLAQAGNSPKPPMNIPEVGTALAYTGANPPLPRPDPRSSALDAIASAQNPASYGNNAVDKLFQTPVTTADFGLPVGTKTITPQFDAQGTIGRDGQLSYSLPGAEPYGGYIPGFDGGGGASPPSVPLPRADPRLTPVSPLPRTTLQTPIPATPLPAATQVASSPAAKTVNINGHPYAVGQIITNPSNGLSYLVNANGTMTKQPHISLGTNTIAGGVAGQAVETAIQKAQAAAPAALASAGGAISGLFGNLFGGGKPTPPMDVPVNTTSNVPQSYGPAGGYYSPPQSILPQATANGLDALAPVADRAQQLAAATLPQTYGPAGGYYSPPQSIVPQTAGPAGGYYSPPPRSLSLGFPLASNPNQQVVSGVSNMSTVPSAPRVTGSNVPSAVTAMNPQYISQPNSSGSPDDRNAFSSALSGYSASPSTVADRAQQLAQYNLANSIPGGRTNTATTDYGGYIPGGTSLPFAGGDPSHPTQSPMSSLNLPPSNPYMGYVPGGISGSPNSPLSAGVGPYADSGSMTLPAPAPKYTTQTVVNPAYTAWQKSNAAYQGYIPGGLPSNDVPQSYGPAGGYYSTPYASLLDKPTTQAPPHYIQKTVPLAPIPQPTPVVPLSPDPSELAALREQAMNPFQRFYGSTPLGHITNFLSGGTQGYGAPQQGGLLGLLSHGFGGMSLPQPAPAMPVNNLANLMKMGLSSGQANSYLSGGAAAQAANPNPIMGAITGALNPQYGSIAAPSSGSVISPFHSF